MYKVVEAFTDLKDNNHVYLAGDDFPRKGAKVSEERVAELASADNKRGRVLIKAVDAPQKGKISPVNGEKTEEVEVPTKSKKQPKKAKKKEK